MGLLHIEMAFLDAICKWLDKFGWTNIFERAKITTTGRVESYLSGSKVKWTRYAHQVSLASLIHLSILSFQKQSTIKDSATWKTAQRSHSVNAEYWFTEIEMEALYFMFIKSVCIGDFDTFLECLKAILPWFSALNHTQYSRWMPVFIQDFSTLERDHKETYQPFKKRLLYCSEDKLCFFKYGNRSGSWAKQQDF